MKQKVKAAKNSKFPRGICLAITVGALLLGAMVTWTLINEEQKLTVRAHMGDHEAISQLFAKSLGEDDEKATYYWMDRLKVKQEGLRNEREKRTYELIEKIHQMEKEPSSSSALEPKGCVAYQVKCQTAGISIDSFDYNCKEFMTDSQLRYAERYNRGTLIHTSQMTHFNPKRNDLQLLKSPTEECSIEGNKISLAWHEENMPNESDSCWQTGKVPVIAVSVNGREIIENTPMAACSEKGAELSIDSLNIAVDDGELTLSGNYDYDARAVFGGNLKTIKLNNKNPLLKKEDIYPSGFFGKGENSKTK
ncbi:MAG: hypothetical protein GC129_04745 [Proteobacteria bacterium]|nr:hypothetical protein [Pseudomonadota bacterium]